MSDSVIFDSATPRFGLPLLHAGQARKEVFVNEALALADSLLHCAVEAESALPPASPQDGQAWLVAAEAIGEWAGRDGALACRQAGAWIFVQPRDGMRIFDRSIGQEWFHFGSWRKADSPVEPLGGMIVDGEARAALGILIAGLRAMGIFPSG